MAQWSQQGYQYPLQTGLAVNPQFLQQNPQFQQQQQTPQFQQAQLTPGFVAAPQQQQLQQQTRFLGARPAEFQQPQQTGYVNQPAFLQQQPTGFIGGNLPLQQQQPRQTFIPPVPPIPSQFQQQGQGSFLGVPQQQQQQPPTRFLTSSPGVGSLSAQPGLLGRGNGGISGPLVPHMTGVVDPRLQMMSSTFMPVNLASPYSAGGVPQLPQQQLPDGLSLQQSFQRHNEDRRGTATPTISWSLSKAEKKNYDNIFRAWDAQGTGYISGQTALEVFGQSGLSKQELANIWYVLILPSLDAISRLIQVSRGYR